MACFGRFASWLVCMLMILTVVNPAYSQDTDSEVVLDASESLIRHYSTDGQTQGRGLTSEEFTSFLQQTTSHTSHYILKVMGDCPEGTNCTRKVECPGIKEIFQQFGVNGFLSPRAFADSIPVALRTLSSENCTSDAEELTYHGKHKSKPSAGEAWGYGIVFTTSVVIISNIGVCLAPIMQKKFFKRLLQFLVAMGAGSLASTALLVLIPESFKIMSIEELGDAYVWKSTVAIFSIYVFFCSERFLKTFLYNKRRRENGTSITVDSPEQSVQTLDGKDGLLQMPLKNGVKENEVGHGHSHGGGSQGDKTTLAWMVMAGDVIHNFVDGLSIGAAFTEDITVGISVSLAVICEELPHELADIAILLHSGFSIKKALFVNFLSACVVYIGLVIGIILGSMIDEASRWIFAMAGGLFLYVPLVDMLPDMSSHLDYLLLRGGHEAKIVAALHTFGLILGAGIIIFIVNISGYITVE